MMAGNLSVKAGYDLREVHSSMSIFELIIDRSGVLWFRTEDNKFYKYDAETDSLQIIDRSPDTPRSLLEDSSGRFWVCSHSGLYLFDRNKETFERQLYEPGNPNRLSSPIVDHIFEDKRKNLWIWTYERISKYSPDLDLLFYQDIPESYYESRTRSSISLHEDHSGNIWYFDSDGISSLVREYDNFKLFNPTSSSWIWNTSICLVNDDSLIYGNQTDTFYTCNLEKDLISQYILHGLWSIYKDSHGAGPCTHP